MHFRCRVAAVLSASILAGRGGGMLATSADGAATCSMIQKPGYSRPPAPRCRFSPTSLDAPGLRSHGRWTGSQRGRELSGDFDGSLYQQVAPTPLIRLIVRPRSWFSESMLFSWGFPFRGCSLSIPMQASRRPSSPPRPLSAPPLRTRNPARSDVSRFVFAHGPGRSHPG